VAASMTPGAHGSTFGGNPLAMAIANAVLDAVLEPGFLDNVVRIGDFFWGELSKLRKRFPTLFVDVRGAGLLLGLKCTRPAADYVDALRDYGMLAHTAGDNVLRLMPPLIIKNEHVVEAMGHLDRMCLTMSQGVDAA
jgi:acetylornithine/N-succinyldiaminopimelate aminotransferase